MNGQLSCEGPQGKTTLLWEKTPGPGFRMRPDDELKPKVNPKDIKDAMLTHDRQVDASMYFGGSCWLCNERRTFNARTIPHKKNKL
ncbi:NADH dehydrogenase flavoprotein 2, mitochondrial precursor [Phytophthora cinnamomi]|uniref:NADH dehydrogenase flavoprotein 2, mitochondrial precursor n=1 Tax=Phytophthora cinnamomi TaxID=4785 RepID=UPI0035594B42|nr:NADH dehydrogenase flavoprotein 2, mitochondrial precursor [Phytophthora cinnamomi]